MKTYRMYRHPTLGLEPVKAGFSWPALCWGVVWLLRKKLWFWAGVSACGYIACSLLGDVADAVDSADTKTLVHIIGLIVNLALLIVPGVNGNAWLEAALVEHGYVLADTVYADSPSAAINNMVASEALRIAKSLAEQQSQKSPLGAD